METSGLNDFQKFTHMCEIFLFLRKKRENSEKARRKKLQIFYFFKDLFNIYVAASKYKGLASLKF